jgi:multidrug efflux pump subunit AcrA (membrane-fusion protein)
MRHFLIASSFIALSTLAGCGASSDAAPPAPGGNGPPVVVTPPPPAPIEGIATPSSVAVVTATNAS